MYLPKNKYIIDYVQPGEVVTGTGTEYTGTVIKLSSGRMFSGNDINTPGPELFPVDELSILSVQRPYNDYFGPTEADYNRGFYIRYFTRDIRNGQFTEVNKDQWNEKRTLSYVTGGQIRWIISGPVEDGKINGFPFKGVSTRNKETLQSLEKQFPGISNFFDNPAEFVR